MNAEQNTAESRTTWRVMARIFLQAQQSQRLPLLVAQQYPTVRLSGPIRDKAGDAAKPGPKARLISVFV
jgi:hypothetical protein